MFFAVVSLIGIGMNFSFICTSQCPRRGRSTYAYNGTLLPFLDVQANIVENLLISHVFGQQYSHYPRKLLPGLPSRYYVFQLPERNLDTEDTTVPPQDIPKYISAIHIPSPSRLAKVITYSRTLWES